MKLKVLQRNLPLRAYQEAELNRALLMDFMPYLSRLLSLTDKTSAERLENALPAIKELCRGMSFVEITKMFEMYADSKLNLKPISNFFDRILLGKIVENYRLIKSMNPPKKEIKEKQLSKEEQEFIMIEAVDRLKKEYNQLGKINSICIHIYDYLFKKGKLPKSKEYKDKIYKKAILIAKAEAKNEIKIDYEKHKKIEKLISEIELGGGKVIAICKRLALEDFFLKKSKKK